MDGLMFMLSAFRHPFSSSSLGNILDPSGSSDQQRVSIGEKNDPGPKFNKTL
jgi:hypothetical protein